MLFHPTPDQNPSAVHLMLDGWNAEVDRFRRAANAAKNGELVISLSLTAAGEAHEAISSLLDQIDEALQRVAPGSRLFLDLLQAQTTAIALLESVTKSRDILEAFGTEHVTGPTRIKHDLLVAAE